MTTAFDPFWFFKAPFAGDVMQRINSPWFSPAFTFNLAGDATVEGRVVSEVASYGRQLGWLSEIVLELAKKEGLASESVTKLENAVQAIESIKQAEQSDVFRAAENALEQLKKSAPELYAELMKKQDVNYAR